MKKTVRLNVYERGIIDALSKTYQISSVTARQLIIEYIEIIRKLGGYDNVEEHADRIFRAKCIGYTPELWLNRILEVEQDMVEDRF